MTPKEDCVECVNFEFRADSLGLNHEDPKVFVQSQFVGYGDNGFTLCFISLFIIWPVSQKVYVIYRIVVALGFIVWFAADCVYETRTFFKEHTYTYLIYATNWSFLLLTVTALYKATCAVYYSVRSGDCLDRQSFDRMPTALKGQWLIQNLSYNSAIVVTASFWSYIGVLEKSAIMQTHMSQMKHTLNTVYVVVDVLISATPFRILHLLYTVVLGSVYSLFNAIYFLNDGTIMEGRHYAYNLLDWSKPSESIVTCVLCVVMCIFAQIVLYELYKIRFSIFTRMYFGLDGKPDSEMQRIMGEMEAPAYQTIEDRGESEAGQQQSYEGTH